MPALLRYCESEGRPLVLVACICVDLWVSKEHTHDVEMAVRGGMDEGVSWHLLRGLGSTQGSARSARTTQQEGNDDNMTFEVLGEAYR